MANLDDAVQAVLDGFDDVRNSGMGAPSKATVYLELAEAYAWLQRPDQPHGATAASD